jgi:hypothetical protein
MITAPVLFILFVLSCGIYAILTLIIRAIQNSKTLFTITLGK